MRAAPLESSRRSARLTASVALAVALATAGAGCASGGGSSSTESTQAAGGACPAGLSAAGGEICVDKADPRAEQFASLVTRLRDKYRLQASIFGLWEGSKQLV